MDSQGPSVGWESLPPELLRRVLQQLLNDWLYTEPCRPAHSLQPVRATCRAWRAVVDTDVKQLALTVPPLAPHYVVQHFPGVSRLDLSRYQHSCQEVFPVLQHLQLRSLVLADPWDPPLSIPTQFLSQLTHLSFLAEGLLVPRIAAQFCQALRQLQQLQELHLSRLQLSAHAAQQLGHVLTALPNLQILALSGGATAVSAAELYMLLDVDLPALRSLELTRLGIRTLPLSLTRFVELTRLTFAGEMIRNVQLTDELRQLTNLEVLDISANLAEQLPGGVLELSSLRELHAGMNRLGVDMHSFRKLEQLQVLVLASNKLLAVHPSLWELTTLKRLDLGHNNLSELPANVSQLVQLTYLNVCHNFLTALPAGLSCLVDLVELDVSLNTDMRELPTGLGQMSKLTRLTASHMRLKQLPEDVGGLVSLVHLDVSHNSLHHLSAQLSCLLSLTHLEASDNKLHQSAAVPEELATLTALKVLRLARNRLQSLPEALGCYGSLQILDCSGNRLTSVPRVVGKCTALQQLLMASNRLRGLTSGIGNLVRLQVLDLSHNQYRHLPTMTGDLTQLQELLLDDNQLEDLPSTCSALIKLTSLTLSNNRLHVLPPAISRMSGLVTLTLRDNPLLDKGAVVLQLQRQLPLLQLDGLPALGISKPTVGPGAEALQLISNWPSEEPGISDTAAVAMHGSNPAQISVSAGAGPRWLLQHDTLSRSLAELIQQAVDQSQEQPAARQVQQHGLMRLMLGDRVGEGAVGATTPDAGTSNPAAGSVGAGPSAVWVGQQEAAALAGVADAHGSGPFPWQRMLAMQPPSSHPVLQRNPGAASSSGAAAGQQQHSPSMQQLTQQLNSVGLSDAVAQHQGQGLATATSSSRQGVAGSDAVSVAHTVSQMASLDGTYASSMDGGGSGGGAGGGGSAAVQLADTLGSNSSAGGFSATSSFVARVKSYLEVATSAANAAAAGKGWPPSNTQQPQQQGGQLEGLHRSASHESQQLGPHPWCGTFLYLDAQVDSMQRSSSAGVPLSAANAAQLLAPSSTAAAAGSSTAAAAAHEQATSSSAAGGAAVSERDADEACSAAGVESCGSEDSGSEVLLRLGNLSHPGTDPASNNAADQRHELLASPYACSPQKAPELAAQSNGFEFSRCPSSTGSMVGAGVGTAVGLGLAGPSAAAADGEGAVDTDSYYRGSDEDGDPGSSTGGAPGQHGASNCTQHGQAGEPGVATSSASGGSQPRVHRESDRGSDRGSFTHVLDSAWWYRRRK